MLPIGPDPRQVQCIRRQGKSDLLVLSPATEPWLRDGYRARMSTDAVLRDLGPMLAHGEPDDGMGQGESTDARRARPERAARRPSTPAAGRRQRRTASSSPSTSAASAPPAPRGMSAARGRLAALAAAAGYGPDTLALIAEAALPGHRPGERLDDAPVAHIRTAVEVLAQAGYPADALGATSSPATAAATASALARAVLAAPAAHRRPALQPPRALRPARRASPAAALRRDADRPDHTLVRDLDARRGEPPASGAAPDEHGHRPLASCRAGDRALAAASALAREHDRPRSGHSAPRAS